MLLIEMKAILMANMNSIELNEDDYQLGDIHKHRIMLRQYF
jgi:hypothetical protein